MVKCNALGTNIIGKSQTILSLLRLSVGAHMEVFFHLFTVGSFSYPTKDEFFTLLNIFLKFDLLLNPLAFAILFHQAVSNRIVKYKTICDLQSITNK